MIYSDFMAHRDCSDVVMWVTVNEVPRSDASRILHEYNICATRALSLSALNIVQLRHGQANDWWGVRGLYCITHI